MDYYIDLPLRSVGTLNAPGIASESTQQQVLAAILALAGNREIVNSLYFDYAINNVDNAAYVEIISSTPGLINFLTLLDSGGRSMELASGLAGFEQRLFVIPPGGFNGEITMPIPAGTRLSIKCLEAGIVNEGAITANFLR